MSNVRRPFPVVGWCTMASWTPSPAVIDSEARQHLSFAPKHHRFSETEVHTNRSMPCPGTDGDKWPRSGIRATQTFFYAPYMRRIGIEEMEPGVRRHGDCGYDHPCVAA